MDHYRIKKYVEFQKTAKSNHHLALMMGEFLDGYSYLNRNSEEGVLVGYYEKCVKHKKSSVAEPKKSASEMLVQLENSYIRDYGVSLADLGIILP